MSEIPAPGVEGGKSSRQKMEEATKCTITSLDTCLNDMADRADLTLSLTVRMKCLISESCYFLDEHFSFLYLEWEFTCLLVQSLCQRAYV